MTPPSTAIASVHPIARRHAGSQRSHPADHHHSPVLLASPPDSIPTDFEVPGLPGSFCIYYLPELDLRSGRIVSCEALLRWRHPDFGLLRPGVTLDGTRWHRQVPAIEQQAMVEVCRQIASWSQDPLGQVALNVSTSFLLGPDFFTSLDRALAASGIDPTHLAIDVPIEAVAADPGYLRHVALQLTERGVGVVIDDVGQITSHRMLRRIPASTWKIDLRAGSTRRRGIHRSIGNALAEARAAGVMTTAKAVEDLDLLHVVRDLGFDRAFGYAISPPVEALAIREVAERGTLLPGPLFGPNR
ncbi:MAG: EAL domain-containing protein [Aquihabitans sp.]